MKAAVAQLVERILGKDEVTGSNPVCSSFFVEKCEDEKQVSPSLNVKSNYC